MEQNHLSWVYSVERLEIFPIGKEDKLNGLYIRIRLIMN
ncbi:MAG: hypothetical protein ACJAUO_001527 [Sediminicola sp.]|jgi:hypothetical protein